MKAKESFPGIYLLTLRLKKAFDGRIGDAEYKFMPGYYVYTGSAMSGLTGRLARHLRTKSTKHWHIDQLLVNGNVVDIQIQETGDKDAECRIAETVASWPGGEGIPGFGCSDCRCESHLCYFREWPSLCITTRNVLENLKSIYRFLNKSYVNHAAFDRDPFKTLVSCILSLRTQDPVTDAASDRLFNVIQTSPEFSTAKPETIEKLIYPVGMYRQKAKQLIRIANELLERFDGKVPSETDELMSLPGVGHKTAALVRSFAFHLPAICVDTHVHRITNRWGLVRTTMPDVTEQALMRVLPESYWMETNALLVQHGQQLCRPIRPKCTECGLRKWCHLELLTGQNEIVSAIDGAPGHPSLKF